MSTIQLKLLNLQGNKKKHINKNDNKNKRKSSQEEQTLKGRDNELDFKNYYTYVQV